jgi:hypothetical protein
MSVIFFQNKYCPKAKCGDNFASECHFPHATGVAFESGRSFFASGLNDGGRLHSATIPNASFPMLKDWVIKSFGDSEPTMSGYVPGTFYKRIWRPLACPGSFHKAISQETLTESFVALRILLNKLDTLFETIEPSEPNLSAYGHKVREILLLACMEVESSWSAVLKDNGYSAGKRFTTNDYVKLSSPMLLDGYTLSLTSYPSFPAFAPFEGWNASNPTISLSWYDAYNKTKHDREDNLNVGTLDNAVKAVGAAVVMFYAQFGLSFGTGFDDQKHSLIRSIFRIVTTDLKKYEKEYYIPNVRESGEMAPGDWVALDYKF